MRTLLFTASILFTVAAFAQPLRAADANEPNLGTRAAAAELLELMQMDQTLDEAIMKMLDAQVRAAPGMANIRHVMEDFFRKYMSWAAIKEDLTTIYAEEFTERELRDIIEFYKTPTGKKLIEKQSALLTRGMELGQRKVQEHLPELQASIREEMAKQQQPPQPPQPQQ